MSLGHQSKEQLLEYVMQLQFASIEAIGEISKAMRNIGAAKITELDEEVVESLMEAVKILSEQWVYE